LPFGDSPPSIRFNFGNVFNKITVPDAGRAGESAHREAQDTGITPHDREIMAQDAEIAAHDGPREAQDGEFMLPSSPLPAGAAELEAAAAGRMVQTGGAREGGWMRAKAGGRVARRRHGQLVTCVWFS